MMLLASVHQVWRVLEPAAPVTLVPLSLHDSLAGPQHFIASANQSATTRNKPHQNNKIIKQARCSRSSCLLNFKSHIY